MAQREGSIYLYLFVVAGVLFMVMTVMFFVNNAEKQEITLQKEAVERKLKGSTEQVKKKVADIKILQELIAGPRAEEWGTEVTKLRDYFTNDELKGKAEKSINEALAELKEASRSYTYLAEPYADFGFLLQKLRQLRDEAFVAREAAGTRQVQDKQAMDAVIVKLRQDKDEALKQIQGLESRYEDLDNTAKTREADLQDQLESLRDDCTLQVTKLKRLNNFQQNEISSLKGKLKSFVDKMQGSQDLTQIEPDGKIRYVLASAGKAWIDLGRADHLTKGFRFRVFQTIKGGKRLFKGSVEVAVIDERLSEVRVVEELDPLNPIVAGDYIASPFYDRGATPVFVFAGTGLESRDVTKELLIAKMESYGAEVSKKVDEKTDYLVATKDYEETPEYKTAQRLQVRIIRERDLLEYLGY